jgi:hypothetical protein
MIMAAALLAPGEGEGEKRRSRVFKLLLLQPLLNVALTRRSSAALLVVPFSLL